MFNLTRQQQTVLGIVLLLFLVGLTVKAWRTSHPPTTMVQPPPIEP